MPPHTLQRHYARILRLWPSDPFRTIKFATSWSKRFDLLFRRPNGVSSSASAAFANSSTASASTTSASSGSSASASSNGSNVESTAKVVGVNLAGNIADSQVQESGTKVFNEARETEELNALYALLENRFSDKYQTSDSLLSPPGKPEHFANLLAEIEEAPNRSWLANKIRRWVRIIRWS